ncbi:hypothetical protein HYPBUDRAFT_110429 [Hyphopichia burtonii NRRL Y-1933]|uniref:TATA element modulatory factor 1 TATA binding domain-containing protein n=1 Tax=Hyphopichia burtonii NRRL Y-1933 TaxID=984485 RepID=A0A1E4RHF1_9ASCO|nr:hypothetical protein HYPBUDRAFT_110429 [Hyphopichia burtonii NRRL Y-1933]ODV66680.1 hypothetical protein HYPBUDRAFT_110429 [Hyphopichia burtonii NRRL Y-1933]
MAGESKTETGKNTEKTNDKTEKTDEKTETGEPNGEPPKTRKRLTLQERLALAAKGGKKSSTKSSVTSLPPEPSTPVASTPVASTPVASTPVASPRPASPANHDELSSLKSQNKELLEELKKLKSQNNNSSDKKDLLLKISQKDETISQLLKEGEQLSIKELKLNDTIKSLKQSNLKLESNLKIFSDKNNEAQLQINELDNFLHKHKFKSIDQLMDSYNEKLKNITDMNNKFDQEKSLNWESKYKEQQKLYDNELSEKKKLSKELNELNIKLDMMKSQSVLDLNSKDNLINNLKKEINHSKEESLNEISRLESKLEFFRIENESFNNDATKNDSKNSENGKVIDYDEFAKLSTTHHNLQQQYISSQENWKLIESNLLSKIDNLSASLDILKKSKLKISNDLKKLTNNLNNKDDEYNDLLKNYESLNKENQDLKLQLNLKIEEIKESQEKYDKFKVIFNNDREKLNVKIDSLNNEILKLKEDSSPSITIDDHTQSFVRPLPQMRSLNNSGLHINIEPPTKSQFRNSSPSIDSPTQSPSWQEIRVGESSTTPAINKDFSSVFLNASHNNSSSSLHDNSSNLNDDYDDSFSSHLKSGNQSISGLMPNSGNNNIQLISKMSSNIRRLEIELNTLKEENSKLSSEKEQAQQELLKKLKLTDEVENLNATIDNLKTEIDNKSAKELTMLQLIGEKSEQVEELKADVLDLKDLCRQQVQQMIELQESK